LLSDDVCAITAETGVNPYIISGFPMLKLWADTLKKFEKDREGLYRVRLDKEIKKYFVPFNNINSSPVPVRSVFILETTNTDEFGVTQLKAGDKIDPIITNTYRYRFLEGLGGKKEHFRQCAAVAAKSAVFKITRPNKGFRLDELMDLVTRYW
jgi:hypothetical protein